jgi:SnoaL-like domain
MRNAQAIADSYVAVWNETDPDRRRLAIAELWAPDGEHFVDIREARGYDALEKRITSSHEKNVRDGGNRFRAAQDARALRDVVTFHWEMLPADSETVVARGLEILIVNDWGRIVTDYQFVLGR